MDLQTLWSIQRVSTSWLLWFNNYPVEWQENNRFCLKKLHAGWWRRLRCGSRSSWNQPVSRTLFGLLPKAGQFIATNCWSTATMVGFPYLTKNYITYIIKSTVRKQPSLQSACTQKLCTESRVRLWHRTRGIRTSNRTVLCAMHHVSTQ